MNRDHLVAAQRQNGFCWKLEYEPGASRLLDVAHWRVVCYGREADIPTQNGLCPLCATRRRFAVDGSCSASARHPRPPRSSATAKGSQSDAQLRGCSAQSSKGLDGQENPEVRENQCRGQLERNHSRPNDANRCSGAAMDGNFTRFDVLIAIVSLYSR